MKRIFLVLFLSLIFLPLASACVDIQIGKTDYFPKETFQAEITGNFARALDNSNIFFYNGDKEISVIFHKDQMASNKYIVYADLPSSYGNYKFSLKNIFCIENNTLKTVDKDVQFNIEKPLAQAYSRLSSDVSAWPSGDDGSLALMTLAYDDALKAKGVDALMASSFNSGQCWPSSGCKVKSTALAVLALDKIGNASKSWLLNSQNNVNIVTGLWDLIVNSTLNQQCNLTINNQNQAIDIKSGNSQIPLSLPNEPEINIQFGCNASYFVSYTYLGSVSKFLFTGNNLSLNNKKCFGSGYRTECDSESTAYALWALKEMEITDPDAESWLKDNAQSTVERAIAFMLTSDASLKEWLINNQAETGYWSDNALVLDNKSSVESTVFSILALGNDESSGSAVDRAKAWLMQQFLDSSHDNFGNIYETSLALAFIFKPEMIEPIISIEPAVFKSKSGNNMTLKINNNGMVNVNGKLNFEGITLATFNASKGSSKLLSFAMPQTSQTEFTSFNLEYSGVSSNRSYNIPVLVWPSTVSEDAAQKIIQENVINNSILPSAIRFIESEINLAVQTGQNIHLHLFNPSSGKVDVGILPNWDLISQNIIDIPEKQITLMPNETREITIMILNKTGKFNGTIDAKTAISSASVPIYLEIKSQAENKSCSSLGGKLCAAGESCSGNFTYVIEGQCCIAGTCKKPKAPAGKSNTMLWVGILLIIIVIAGLIFFLKSRLKKKPKKGVAEELKKIEERYNPESRIEK